MGERNPSGGPAKTPRRFLRVGRPGPSRRFNAVDGSERPSSSGMAPNAVSRSVPSKAPCSPRVAPQFHSPRPSLVPKGGVGPGPVRMQQGRRKRQPKNSANRISLRLDLEFWFTDSRTAGRSSPRSCNTGPFSHRPAAVASTSSRIRDNSPFSDRGGSARLLG